MVPQFRPCASKVQLGRPAHPRPEEGREMCYANPPVDPVAREIHRVTLRHEVLAAVVSGRHVVLCDRTNLVRGEAELGEAGFSEKKVEVHISNEDRHLLGVVRTTRSCLDDRKDLTSVSAITSNRPRAPTRPPLLTRP